MKRSKLKEIIKEEYQKVLLREYVDGWWVNVQSKDEKILEDIVSMVRKYKGRDKVADVNEESFLMETYDGAVKFVAAIKKKYGNKITVEEVYYADKGDEWKIGNTVDGYGKIRKISPTNKFGVRQHVFFGKSKIESLYNDRKENPGFQG